VYRGGIYHVKGGCTRATGGGVYGGDLPCRGEGCTRATGGGEGMTSCKRFRGK